MPTMSRREGGAQRSMLMISLPIAARLGAGPLRPWHWTLAHWGARPGRCVGAGWRGMPARAICCEPDSGKCGRQAVDEPIARCIFRQVEGLSMNRVGQQWSLFVAPSEFDRRPFAIRIAHEC
jgi:hypothetical protein